MRIAPIAILILLTAHLVASDDQIPGTVVTGVAAGSAPAEIIVTAGGTHYRGQITPQVCRLLGRYEAVHADGAIVTTPMDGLIVAADGSNCRTVEGLPAGTPVQVVIGQIGWVWMAPRFARDGKSVIPGEWIASAIRASAFDGPPVALPDVSSLPTQQPIVRPPTVTTTIIPGALRDGAEWTQDPPANRQVASTDALGNRWEPRHLSPDGTSMIEGRWAATIGAGVVYSRHEVMTVLPATLATSEVKN